MKRIYLLMALLAGTAARAQALSQLSMPQFKSDFLQSINQVRAKGCNCGITYMRPVAPITWNDQLAAAASEHAVDMARKNYFSHDTMDGRSLKDRFFNVGYTFKGYQGYTIGENIAMGQHTIPEVSAGWFKSPGHCKNLMNPDFKEVGIAEYNYYWVEDFGGRKPF